MCEIIIYVCLLFFSSVGFSVILGKLWITLLKPKKRNNANLVVMLNGAEDEEQINFYLEKFKWYGSDFADKLYFVSKGEISEECTKLCESVSNVYCCSHIKI